MGAKAELLAIGPYDVSLARYMDYPAANYATVPHGCPVVTTLFQQVTHDGSMRLAAALQMNLDSIRTHCMDGLDARDMPLGDLAELVDVGYATAKDLAAFDAMRKLKGYMFILRPEC